MDETSIPNFPISFLDFTAEEVLVTIIPSISHPTFKLTSYDVGPLESGMPVQVPLWLAVTLRKRGKCKIQIPSWLQKESLELLVKEEKSEHQRMLGILPFQYTEIANLLLTYANEDMDYPEQVASLIQDLVEIRGDRIKLGIASIAETIQSGSSVISTNLQNVSSLEVFTIRQFFLGSMDSFLWLKPPLEENHLYDLEGDGNTSSVNNNANGSVDYYEADENNQSRPVATKPSGLRKHRK
jgi:GINS complex subunit 2